jgi:transcriptional regulator with GAF, ATPase, and Fis domain
MTGARRSDKRRKVESAASSHEWPPRGVRGFPTGETQVEREPELIIGESAAIRRVLEPADQVAATNATVVLMGRNRYRKELFATRIDASSQRRHRSMVRLSRLRIRPGLTGTEITE